MHVPIIDIADWGESAERDQHISAAIDEVCRSVGFLKISGHGVDPHLIEQLHDLTDQFFDQDLAAKSAFVTPPEIDRGYTPSGREGLSYSIGLDTPPDLFEAFNIGVGELLGVDASEGTLWAANLWPDAPVGFRAAWLAYAEALYGLANRMLEIFAVALGLERGWLVERADRSPDVMRAINYQRRPGDPEPLNGQLRMGAHSDYGTCTILLADAVPGLQIMGLDGEWHDVLPTPGTFLVNIGDLLAAWTNDAWRSTVHRVVPPPPDAEGAARRRSVAYFHEANPDVIVEPLPAFADPEAAVTYEPFSVGDHLTGKVVGPRSLSISEGTSTLGDRAANVGAPLESTS